MAKTKAKIGAKTPSGSAPDARLRALHAVPPTDFTARRDALARELASEGSADAARVKRLRRPNLPVWLLNALARERPEELGALLAAGDRLRQAQIRAMRGDTAELRTANADLSESVADLLRAAAAISAATFGRDPAASLLADVERGLRAATTADASERAALEGGVLDHLPEPGGLELLAGLSAVPVPRVPRGAAEEKHRPRQESTRTSRGVREGRDARAAQRARKAEEKRARAEAARRERERRRAAAEAERLERAERQADARVREAERAIEEAQRRLSIARNEADRSRASARSARERADAKHRS